MKKACMIILFASLISGTLIGQNLKPYILAGEVSGQTVAELSTEVKDKLNAAGFKILGSYNPVNTSSRKIIAVSHPEIRSAVAKTGGLTGFALALRVAITKEGDKLHLSYTNPLYWGAAYFTKQYDQVSSHYLKVDQAFKKAFVSYTGTDSFGSKKGLSIKKLKKYQYMMGMPYFEDNVKLATFSSHQEALARLDANLKGGAKDLQKVYKISVPEKNLTLYGIGLKGETGEGNFMPVIDQSTPRHTAFLPYEILVSGNTAYMLHGRYRIALSFPDLTMGTFMKIVSTPGNIEDMLKSACH